MVTNNAQNHDGLLKPSFFSLSCYKSITYRSPGGPLTVIALGPRLAKQRPSGMLLAIVQEGQKKILENLTLVIKCESPEVTQNSFTHNSLARTSYMALPNRKGVFWVPGGKGN